MSYSRNAFLQHDRRCNAHIYLEEVWPRVIKFHGGICVYTEKEENIRKHNTKTCSPIIYTAKLKDYTNNHGTTQ